MYHMTNFDQLPYWLPDSKASVRTYKCAILANDKMDTEFKENLWWTESNK